MDAFSLLAEPIRRVLWQMRWTELRPIQAEAIPKVLHGNGDLVLAARTAAGKTEAAFLPILSAILDSPRGSVRAIYVGPLKALINDQFRRLEELCRHADIPVHRWHGDVSAERKRELIRRPSGVLLITPESIESMFVNRGSALPEIFHSLSFVVIDELHAMLGTERGRHLRSLLHRLEAFPATPYRFVALSATIGDLAAAGRWLRPDAAGRVEVISDEGQDKAVLYRIHGYLREKPNEARADESVGNEPVAAAVDDLLKAFAGRKGLVFANPKAAIELYADALNDRCRREGLPEQFLVHHGSLSREIREETERLMQGDRPFTTVCSSTLELGIDIGDVQLVGHIGSPWSVSSLVQRLGRSGRKDGEPHSMRVYIEEVRPEAKAHLCDRLYLELLRAIALTELMLEKWVEPPDLAEFDLSTLVQQILSVLAETGGIRADRLFEKLAVRGAFRYVDRETFVAVLRSMAERDLIEQMAEGDLILGLAGQRVVGHYDFYSAFATPPEYRLVYGGRPLGRLPASTLPREKDHVLFAGRRWVVVVIDHDREEILVEPARGRKAPLFEPSRAEVHPRVRERMRSVVTGSGTIAYLDAAAASMLDQARAAATAARLGERPLIETSSSTCLWFTWTGTKAQRTLAVLADMAGLEVDDRDVALDFRSSAHDVLAAFAEIRESPPSPLDVAEHWAAKRRRKYDGYLTDALLELALSKSAVDLKAAIGQIDSTMLWDASERQTSGLIPPSG